LQVAVEVQAEDLLLQVDLVAEEATAMLQLLQAQEAEEA
jgi:hypothetical protein